MLTIHQPRPDVLMMFDSIILMTSGKGSLFWIAIRGIGILLIDWISLPFPDEPGRLFYRLDYVDTRNPTESQKRIDFILNRGVVWKRCRCSA